MNTSLVVLDTNIVSYFFNGHSNSLAYEEHLKGFNLGISFVTVGEMLQGAYRAHWSENEYVRSTCFCIIFCWFVIRTRFARTGRESDFNAGIAPFRKMTHGSRQPLWLMTHRWSRTMPKTLLESTV